MRWFKNITRSGISNTVEYQERRGILLSNYISLTLCVCLMIMFIIRQGYFGNIPGGMKFTSLCIGLFVFIIPVIFNRIGLTTMSRLLLCYIPVLFLWFASISQMLTMPVVSQASYDSVRIFLLAFSATPYLLLNRKSPFTLLLGILPTFLSLLFFDFILSQFGLGIQQRGIPGGETYIIGTRTFVAYCILSFTCFIFQSIITYNDELNKTILEELKQKTEEIKAQNEELVQSQDRLNEINLHLEELVMEKIENIKQQNERLLKYAYSNAHHVRGPVARLLGLVQLSRIKSDLDYPWFFEKVEQEAHQVDEILKGIAKDLDEITQNINES